MQRKAWTMVALTLGLAFAVPASAQQLAINTEREGSRDARTTVVRFLERPEVRRAGSMVGIDTDELVGRVDELDDSESSRIASRVADYEENAATAAQITISTMAIVIGLLVLILLILIL